MIKRPKHNSLAEEKEYNLMLWVSFWRANPHRFVKDYLDVNLKFFQKILIYLMDKSPLFVFIASRGLGKTYLVAVYAVTRCILYPGSKVVVASKTKSQARDIITKITELKNRSEALNMEIEKIRPGINDAGVDFKCGSFIQTSVAGENTRGKRGNVLIVDEFILIDPIDYEKVLVPLTNVPRIPRFKEKYEKKYANYEEDNVKILMSSAGYKSNWGWGMFKKSVNDMVKSQADGEEYLASISVALPYQLSLIHGLLQQSTVDERTDKSQDMYSFMMEYEAVFVGENENAFFTFDVLDRNRKIMKAFVPPTHLEYRENQKRAIPKYISTMPLQKGEIRVISLDVALVGGVKNDTSVITGIRMIPNSNDGYDRHVVYIDTLGEDGIRVDDLAKEFKRLFYDFEATYAVLDAGGSGFGVYDELTKPTYDEERDVEYEAWSSMNREDLAKRADRSAKQVLHTVVANNSYNAEIAIALKSALTVGKMKFLISDMDMREKLNADKSIVGNLDEQQRQLSSYQQTTALVNELIALSWSQSSSGNIIIKEPSGGRKDRYTSLAYANQFINEIELKNKRSRGVQRYNPEDMITNWK